MVIKVKNGKCRRFEGLAGKSTNSMITAPIEDADIIISIPDTYANVNDIAYDNPYINFLINTGVTLNWNNKKTELTSISSDSVYSFKCGLKQVNSTTYEIRWVAKRDGNIIGSSNQDNSDVDIDFTIISQIIKPATSSVENNTGNSYCCYNNFCINCGNSDSKMSGSLTVPCFSFGLGQTLFQIKGGALSSRGNCYLMIGPDIDGIVDRDIVDIDEDITLMSTTLSAHEDDIDELSTRISQVDEGLHGSFIAG